MKNSGLRGRGGAGFPTGLKWSFLPQGDGKPHYLVVNADEGEPGTCKDIPYMMADPHALIEGCIITCFAIRSEFCAIYVRGEAIHSLRRLTNAVNEAKAAGFLGQNILGSGFNLEIVIHARRRGVHLRRGNRPAGFARGPSRSAATQAAVPGGGRPVRLPDRGQQRRDHCLGAGHRAGRQRLVPVDGHRQVAGPQDLFAVRTRHPAGPVRGADGHHAAPAAGVGRRHAERHSAQVLHSWRVVDADLHPPAPGRAAVLRRRGRRRLDARAPPR